MNKQFVNNRFVLCVFFCILTSIYTQAQQMSMRDVWMQMPDSLFPSTSKDQRKTLLDFWDMKVAAEVKNNLDGMTRLDSLTNDFAQFNIGESVKVQLKLLPYGEESQQLICMLKTFSAPFSESEILFFDTQWNKMTHSYGLPRFTDSAEMLSSLTEMPDTMTSERYNELLSMMEPVMVTASLSGHDHTVTLTLTSPVLTQKEYQDINRIVLQRKLKWNGVAFK